MNFLHFDHIKCLRLISALNILDCYALIHSPKSAKRYLQRATDFYEKFTKKQRDRGWSFDFIKPFYKELFCYRNLLTSPVSLRRFWYNLLLTSDYYPKKLQLGGEELKFKAYLGLLVFSFYVQLGPEWDLLRKFFANFLSACFSKFGRPESALFFLGHKLTSLRFEQMSKKEIRFHFAEFRSQFLDRVLARDNTALLSSSHQIPPPPWLASAPTASHSYRFPNWPARPRIGLTLEVSVVSPRTTSMCATFPWSVPISTFRCT